MESELKSLKLLDQIINFEKWLDEKQKIAAVENHKSSQAVGESWTVHHLKNLRELIILEHAQSDDNRPERKEK